MTEIRVDKILQESGTGPVNFETEFTLKGKALNDSAGALQMTKIVDSATNPIDSDSYYGLMWFDSSNDRLNIYTPIGWRTFNGTAVGSSSAIDYTYSGITWGGDRGISAGGNTPDGSVNTIDYWDITTSGNASDFGDMTVATTDHSMTSSTTRGLIFGGSGGGALLDEIDYITISTTGNATNFGLLPNGSGVYRGTAASNGTYALHELGITWDSLGQVNTIEYVTIDTTGNSSDFGDLLTAKRFSTAAATATYYISAGDYSGSPKGSNVMEYVNATTPGNTTDFGDLSSARYSMSACSDTARIVFCGGRAGPSTEDVMEYVTADTPGNATDLGDLNEANYSYGACSNGVYGNVFGGNSPSGRTDSIQRLTIQTAANATDAGDLTASVYKNVGCAGDPS